MLFLSLILPLNRSSSFFFFFNDTATTEIYTLSLHDALPISTGHQAAQQASDQSAQATFAQAVAQAGNQLVEGADHGGKAFAVHLGQAVDQLGEHAQRAALHIGQVLQRAGHGGQQSVRGIGQRIEQLAHGGCHGAAQQADRKSTRLNSSHLVISYAVFCLKKKKHPKETEASRHTPCHDSSLSLSANVRNTTRCCRSRAEHLSYSCACHAHDS